MRSLPQGNTTLPFAKPVAISFAGNSKVAPSIATTSLLIGSGQLAAISAIGRSTGGRCRFAAAASSPGALTDPPFTDVLNSGGADNRPPVDPCSGVDVFNESPEWPFVEPSPFSNPRLLGGAIDSSTGSVGESA
jgi:hypothetical protein